jgi:thymidylate kinase
MGLPLIIVITGIDGSGKTTQSELLSRYLTRMNINSCCVQQFSSDSTPSKIIINKFAKKLISLERKYSNNPYFIQSSKTPDNFFRTFIRKFAELRILSMSIFRTWNKIIKNFKFDIIVFDRYVYDDVNKAIWLYNTAPKIESLIYHLVPNPVVVFYLDLPAEVAWKREVEGNTSLGQHVNKKEVYDTWFSRQQNRLPIYKISSLTDPECVHKEITDILQEIEKNGKRY